MFIDGVMYGTGTSINVDIKNATNDLTIGGEFVGAGYWNGVISNVRIVNGTALYTSNFTPPTAPLTNVTNTKLLCCQSSTSATAATAAPGTITANGDASAASLGDTDWTVNNLVATAGLETASQGVDVVTYSGTSSTQSISSLAFQPDFIWIKNRSKPASHHLYDVVRGVSARLRCDRTDVADTAVPITSFDSNGFTLPADVTDAINTSSSRKDRQGVYR